MWSLWYTCFSGLVLVVQGQNDHFTKHNNQIAIFNDSWTKIVMKHQNKDKNVISSKKNKMKNYKKTHKSRSL